jgi:hypothetical protein
MLLVGISCNADVYLEGEVGGMNEYDDGNDDDDEGGRRR